MLSVIDRLLRLVKLWIVRRTHSSPAGRSGSGESIFSTSAPMSASITAGSSAAGPRASSRILMPSITPIALLPLRGEPRGERAHVGYLVEPTNLHGDSFRGVGAQDRHGAAAELGVQLGIAERGAGMAGGAARFRLERGPVREPHAHPAPGVLLEIVRQRGIDDHRDARHELPRGGVAHRTVLEVGETDGAARERRRRAILHRELSLETIRGMRVAEDVRHHGSDAYLDGADLRRIDRVTGA